MRSEPGPGGRRVPSFPQAHVLRWLLSWCSRHGLNPRRFYEEEFSGDRAAWLLVAAFEAWEGDQRAKEIERGRTSGRRTAG
jgi:hypothetical protein